MSSQRRGDTARPRAGSRGCRGPGDHARIGARQRAASGKTRSRTSSRSDASMVGFGALRPGVGPEQPMCADQHPEDALRHVDEDGDSDQERVPAPLSGRAPTRPSWRRARRAPVTPRPPSATPRPHRPRSRGPRRDERERQQPDEEAVCERAGDDPAADLAVAVDHLERRIDGLVQPALGLGALGEPLRRASAEGSPATTVCGPVRRSVLHPRGSVGARPHASAARQLGHLRAARSPSALARRSGSTRRSARR